MSIATPLYAAQRQDNYVRQNNGGAMTLRQRRRWKHKLNRRVAAALKVASGK